MSNILDKNSVLSLNSAWIPIGTRSVREAILAMNAVSTGERDQAAVGLDITYKQNPDGSYDFSKPEGIVPVAWGEWVGLEIRPFDEVIHTTKLTIRCPQVVVAVNFKRVPLRSFRPCKKTIYEREKGKCAYTGKSLTMANSNIDHILPKSKGGRDTFENLVLCDPVVNSRKGDRTNEEAGLKLLIKPKAPLPVTVGSSITRAISVDWQWFLINKRRD